MGDTRVLSYPIVYNSEASKETFSYKNMVWKYSTGANDEIISETNQNQSRAGGWAKNMNIEGCIPK